MRFFIGIIFSLMMFSAQARACTCTEMAISPIGAIERFIMKHYGSRGVNIQDQEIRWVKYYPSVHERMTWSQVRGTTCESTGPNGEIFAICEDSRKSEYLVVLPNASCQVHLEAKSTTSKVTVTTLSTNCPRD